SARSTLCYYISELHPSKIKCQHLKSDSYRIRFSQKIKEYLLSFRKRNDKSKWLAKAGDKLEN
ncbi:MAG: hypothetical protein U9R19_01560, partial [Bacteroidota bacterium]|nr:hypothetical protein [Bacteroidota bacterium]